VVDKNRIAIAKGDMAGLPEIGPSSMKNRSDGAADARIDRAHIDIDAAFAQSR
jgi:hypothetical protein